MALSPWLRFWLPLGNALLLVAILDTVDIIRNGLKDTGILIYQGMTDEEVDITSVFSVPEIVFLSIIIVGKLVANLGFLWFGAIFQGNKTSLLIWIIGQCLSSFAVVIFLIVGFVQALSYPDRTHVSSLVYSLVVFIIFEGFTIIIACATYQALERQEVLQPIGKGFVYMWEYFGNESRIAATFFLISEIVLDGEYLVSRQFIQFFGVRFQGHEGDDYPPIIVEEIVLRVVRILVNAIGIWLVQTEKRRIFRWWCAFTFILILVSTTIFVILTVLWRGEEISVTLAYFLMFPGHLLYRFVTLYFCLKYTRADFSSFVL